MTRSLGRVGMLLLLSLLFAVPAAANHVQCGDTITQDTTLDSDLICDGDGLTVEASDVTLDLNRHVIQGSGAFSRGVTVWNGDRVQIRGGTIRGFYAGVDTDGPRGTALIDVVLERNGAGLHCAYAPECRIEDSIVRNNQAGIEVDAADGGSPEPTIVRRNRIIDNRLGMTITGQRGIVTDNRIARNETDGIRNDYGLPVDISRNVVADNGEIGVRILYLARATVATNRISGNGGDGVAVFGSGGEFGDTNANVDNNRIGRNGGAGVLVQGQGVDAVVQRNRSDRNAGDGIDVGAGSYTPACCFEVVVRANEAFFNTDLGIEAAPGTTDGGGNRAKHNGNPAQCVGVSCK